MKIYQLYLLVGQTIPNHAFTINKNGSVTSFVFDPDNTDYQAFLKFLAEGGTPLPADS